MSTTITTVFARSRLIDVGFAARVTLRHFPDRGNHKVVQVGSRRRLSHLLQCRQVCLGRARSGQSARARYV